MSKALAKSTKVDVLNSRSNEHNSSPRMIANGDNGEEWRNAAENKARFKLNSANKDNKDKRREERRSEQVLNERAK